MNSSKKFQMELKTDPYQDMTSPLEGSVTFFDRSLQKIVVHPDFDNAAIENTRIRKNLNEMQQLQGKRLLSLPMCFPTSVLLNASTFAPTSKLRPFASG